MSRDQLYISSITEFELLTGATQEHKAFWNFFLERIEILDFDSRAARVSAEIITLLKPKRKSIDMPDLFIASTAIVNDLTLDTLNKKDFIHIDYLKLLD